MTRLLEARSSIFLFALGDGLGVFSTVGTTTAARSFVVSLCAAGRTGGAASATSAAARTTTDPPNLLNTLGSIRNPRATRIFRPGRI